METKMYEILKEKQKLNEYLNEIDKNLKNNFIEEMKQTVVSKNLVDRVPDYVSLNPLFDFSNEKIISFADLKRDYINSCTISFENKFKDELQNLFLKTNELDKDAFIAKINKLFFVVFNNMSTITKPLNVKIKGYYGDEQELLIGKNGFNVKQISSKKRNSIKLVNIYKNQRNFLVNDILEKSKEIAKALRTLNKNDFASALEDFAIINKSFQQDMLDFKLIKSIEPVLIPKISLYDNYITPSIICEIHCSGRNISFKDSEGELVRKEEGAYYIENYLTNNFLDLYNEFLEQLNVHKHNQEKLNTALSERFANDLFKAHL